MVELYLYSPYVRLKIPSAVTVKTTALWDVTPCGMVLVTYLKTATFNKQLDGHYPSTCMVKLFQTESLLHT